jgi:hypothetical protein
MFINYSIKGRTKTVPDRILNFVIQRYKSENFYQMYNHSYCQTKRIFKIRNNFKNNKKGLAASETFSKKIQ